MSPEGDFPSKCWGHPAAAASERSALLLIGVAIPVYNQDRSQFGGLFPSLISAVFSTISAAFRFFMRLGEQSFRFNFFTVFFHDLSSGASSFSSL